MVKESKKLNNNLLHQEYIRYSRQITLENIGIEGQKKLKKTKVLVIGAGGLGCPTMIYLVSSGIGCIGIIDKDKIERSNLNRQILYSETNIGEAKTKCAKEKLQTLNEYTKIVAHNWKISDENSLEVIRYYDIVIDATDNFNTRHVIDKACYRLHKSYIHGAIDEFEGEIAILNYKNGLRYKHLYESYLKIAENTCNRNGMMGINTGYIGLLQTIETVKTILGLDKRCKNLVVRHNILKSEIRRKLINPRRYFKINESKREKGEIIHRAKINNINNINIDLREENEFKKDHSKKAINIPFVKLNLIQAKILIMHYARHKNVIINCNEKEKSVIASKILDKHKIAHTVQIKRM